MKRLVLLIALALSASTATAAPTVTTISASALDKFFDAVPAPRGTLGWHQITAPRPCVPNFWNTCTVTLFSGEVSWSMTAPRFTVTPSGVTIGSTLTATFAGLTATAQVNANVSLSVSGTNVFVALSSVNVPVSFNLPGYGSWSPGSVTIPLNSSYGLAVPFLHTRIEVPAADGGKWPLTLLTTKASLSYQTGAVVLSTEHLPW